MKLIRSTFRNLPWYSLAFLVAILAFAPVVVITDLLDVFDTVSTFILVSVIVSCLLLVVGSIVGLNENYALVPETKQILGATLIGMLGGVAFLISLEIVTASETIGVASLLLALSWLYFIELVSVRLQQQKRVTASMVTSVLIVLGSSLWFFQGLSTSLLNQFLILISIMIGIEVVHKGTVVHYLTPWVSGLWNGVGLLFFVSGYLWYYTAPMSDLQAVMNQPIWLGVVVALVGIVILMYRFAKQKLQTTTGYMQFKLQFLTVILGVFALLSTQTFTPQILIAFIGLLIGYTVLEQRLPGKK